MTQHPVLIAGGGPVGMTAALLLARLGVPCVVVEAKPSRELIGSKSICVQRDVLDIYQRAGVGDALMAQSVTWQLGRTYYREHELFTTTFSDTGRSAYPGFVNLGQSSVERELAAAIEREPLVELRYGHQLVAVRQDADVVEIRCQTPAGTVDLTGTHLIAADGARSVVRCLLWLDFDGQTFGDLFLIADIKAALPFPAERRFYFDPAWNPGRQVLVHPQPDSIWRIDWQVPDDFDLSAEEASGGLDERIRRVTGDTPYEVQWLSLYRFHQRLASKMRVGRILLAGDAAHLMSPFGARGLNSGVQDAENAAWKIAFERAGWAGPLLLESYEIERMDAARENLRVTAETMRFLVPHGEREWHRRREVLRGAVHDQTARALVDSGKLAEPYWYLHSPLTTGQPPAGFPTAPGAARPPVGGVLCPDGPTIRGRLRELFGPGLVVLCHGFDAHLPDGIPAERYRLDQIDADGVVTDALGAAPGWCGVVRPDGHLAAVLHSPSAQELESALRRACGHPR